MLTIYLMDENGKVYARVDQIEGFDESKDHTGKQIATDGVLYMIEKDSKGTLFFRAMFISVVAKTNTSGLRQYEGQLLEAVPA